MAKGSVRKKGKKWYYRFYVENESGNLVQKEYAGTESKSETEKLLRKAMEDYEERRFVAKMENITLGEMLDIWLEEEVKPGTLSTGTLIAYTTTARQIKKHPIGQRKLKSITADHLQEYIDFLSFGGTKQDGTQALPISKNYMLQFSAVLLRGAFRFAVFPKRYITFNPMQYVRMRVKKEEVELFEGNAENFHFHQLRHAYTSNLLSNGAAPKDVQELLGHSDVSTTMNVYAHATREAKRTSARLLDKVVGS